MTVYIWGPKDKAPHGIEVINTTSRSLNWSRGLSPFYLGPISLYGDYVATNVENAWQYSKVYQEHVDNFGNPKKEYYDWALFGWSNPRAIRYPMGKGRIPLYSLWDEKKMTYVEARAKIYVPLYSSSVLETEAYTILRDLYKKKGEIHLWDFDGYNHLSLNMTLNDVLNDPKRKMGHAFVLAALLTKGK